MNSLFIEKCHSCLSYRLKEGTKASFYCKTGENGILPERLSLGIYAQKQNSRKDYLKKNEVNGIYKKTESGLYRMLNHGRIHTSIWEMPEFPEFYGYGEIDERHGIYDLIVLFSEDNCNKTFDIHIFRGMYKPEYIKKAFEFLRLKKKPQMNGAWG